MRFPELVIFAKKKMQIALLLFTGSAVILSYQNCSSDAFQTSESLTELVSSNERFTAAKAVLEARCFSCHNGISSSSINLNLNTENDYMTAGLITPGAIATSKLIYRIHNYPIKDGAQNMPPSGPLGSAEYNTLVDWINNINTQVSACTSNSQFLAPQIKRLTQNQFRNSIIATFGGAYLDSRFPNFGDANPELGLANDPDLLRINEINIQNLFEATSLLVYDLLNQNTQIRNCINETTDTCYRNLVESFGLTLWRRPLSPIEISDIMSGLNSIVANAGTRSQAIEYVLKSLIISPNHLFRTEIGPTMNSSNTAFLLTHYEIASLLSFTIWDGPPDSQLLLLAREGRLQNPLELRNQVDRMIQDSRFQKKMTSFIVDLLKLESVKTVFKDPSLNLTEAERQAIFLSATSSLDRIFTDPNTSVLSPFSTNEFFVNSSSARFFNLNQSNFTSTLELQNLDPTSQRHGILSHPAFLTSISGELGSGIVKRGVFTLEQLLCNHLGTPPAGIGSINNIPSTEDPEKISTRVLLQRSHSGQSSCIGCHSKIDPAGFGFENFNALGIFRTTEKNNVPIDASGTLVGATDSPLTFANSVTYLEAISSSPTFKSCVVKKYFKYASGQSSETPNGKCELVNFEQNLAKKPDTTASLIQSFVELKSFITRETPAN